MRVSPEIEKCGRITLAKDCLNLCVLEGNLKHFTKDNHICLCKFIGICSFVCMCFVHLCLCVLVNLCVDLSSQLGKQKFLGFGKTHTGLTLESCQVSRSRIAGISVKFV